MAVNTSNFPSLMYPLLYDVFWNKDAYPAQYKEIYSIHKSSMIAEYVAEVQMIGATQEKQQGGPTYYQDMKQTYVSVYTHIYFVNGTIFTSQFLEDNQYKSKIPDIAAAMMFSQDVRKNEQGAAIFNNAFDPTYPGADGQPLCSLYHPVEGGYFSNMLPVPAPLTPTTLQSALIAIKRFKNEANLPINISANKLLVPAEQIYQSEIITQSHELPYSGDRAINPIYTTKALPGGYTVNNFLTNPGNTFILTSRAKDAFKWFDREPFRIDTTPDIDTDNIKTRSICRYSCGYDDPRGVFGIQAFI